MFGRQTWILVALILVVMGTLSVSTGAATSDEKKKASTVDLITADELKSKVTANEPLLILDVRGAESYASSTSRIKGAVHVVVRKLKYRLGFAPLKNVPKDREVVTYCACPSDEASIAAAQVLLESGFKRVRVLKGGWQEWQKASGPIEPRQRS